MIRHDFIKKQIDENEKLLKILDNNSKINIKIIRELLSGKDVEFYNNFAIIVKDHKILARYGDDLLWENISDYPYEKTSALLSDIFYEKKPKNPLSGDRNSRPAGQTSLKRN